MSLHSIKSEFLYGDARFRKNRNLPHLDVPQGVYFMTFNLADALPQHVRERLKRRRAEIRQAIDKARGTSAFRQVDQIRRAFLDECERELDQGHGECLLRQPEVAEKMVGILKFFDGQRYDLFSWSVMPNHVHSVLRLADGVLSDTLLHSWKSYSSKEFNRMLGRSGQFWQGDYFDRTIRTREELRSTIEYVANNPSAAGLSNWPWVGVGEEALARAVGHL